MSFGLKLKKPWNSTLLERGAWWDVAQIPAQKLISSLVAAVPARRVYKTVIESKELGTLQRETHDFWVDLHPLANKHWDIHALDVQAVSPKDQSL